MAGENDGEYTEGASEVHSITSAAPGHSVDMHQRMVRYSLAMGIRMVCIIALFFLDGWFKLIAVAGAVFLPWVAVVIANAQTTGESFDSELLDHVSYGELGTGYVEDDTDRAGETIQGEMIDDDITAPPKAADRQTGSEKEHPRDPEAGAA
ncbi:hypothetical protein GCM10027449_31520 [Sinomonas notoginsengisoli]